MALPIQSPGVTSVGAIKVRSNDALAAEQAEGEASTQPVAVTMDRLAQHIESCWSAAKKAKLEIEQQMLRNLRQRNGIYEPSKLATIREMGGSEVYMLLTSTKCRAAEAWIEDILKPVYERPWSISPTPLPDLPPYVVQTIIADVQNVAAEVLNQAAQVGQQINSAVFNSEIRKYAEGRKEEALKQIRAEAERRALRMSDKIADQLAQGGWHENFWAVISDLVTLKAGVLKGPVLRSKKVRKWTRGPDGKWVPALSEDLVPEFERVSPFDIYPAPGSRHPDDDYLIERHRMTRADLQALLGVPGYSDEKIRMVIKHYGERGFREELYPDSERRQHELGRQDNTDITWIEAIQFWGNVQGKLLIEWGISRKDIDPERDYEIDAWKIGNYVIRAVLNPDKLGRKPYSISGYEKVAGSFWFKGVPELMGDLQDLCNAVARALANNSMLASGPMVEIDIERVSDGSSALYPWKIFHSTNRQMSEHPAVRYNQPQIIVDPLLKAFDFFMTMAEDQTNIPRWSHGNSNMGGAGSTSSGLSMLMTAATRGMKKVISHIDDMIASAIGRLYDYNMLYDEDETIKGDCQIVARGTSSLVEKEQKVIRRTEFLAATGNPIDVQLVGLKNRAKMILQQAKDLGLEVDAPEELPMAIQAVAAQLAAQGQPRGSQPAQAPAQPPGSLPPPEGPQELDQAGNPAGGVDDATQMNQPGVTP